jgi:hypothetical protein
MARSLHRGEIEFLKQQKDDSSQFPLVSDVTVILHSYLEVSYNQ